MTDLFPEDPKERRDAAMKRTLERHGLWADKALAILYAFEKGWRGMGEDGRHIVQQHIGPPPDPHVWGAVWRKAVMAGYFRSTGQVRAPRDSQSNASKKQVWYRT